MKMKPGKTFENLSPEKQERITRIAAEEFGDKGFDGASVNAMVDRMGIAKGSIFQYFGHKKGLFLFVFNQSVEKVKDYLRTVRDQSIDEDLPTRLEKTLAAGIDFIRSHPLLYRLYIKVLSESKVPFREEILLSLRQHSIGYLKSLLDQAYLKKEIRKTIDLEKASFILDAVMDRFLQAHTMIHIDGGLGIYRASSEATNIWIKDMVGMIYQGIGGTDADNSEPYHYILIIAAVDAELDGFRTKLENPSSAIVGKRNALSGRLSGHQVMLLTTGPGMINTAQALTAAIEFQKPALIVQTGCAGAFHESGLQIGDVAIATREIDIHTGLEPVNGSVFPDPLPFSLFQNRDTEYTNYFSMDENLVADTLQVLQSVGVVNGFNVKKGPFITVSTVTTTDQRANDLFQHFKPCMEQMEGSAAAHTAMIYDIPFIEIRGASNMVGKRDKNSWNLPLAFQNAGIAVEAIMARVNELNGFRLKAAK
ncbi:MAG: futalosine hydrolase [Desulfobacteraceae bacterium]|nr:MAG: futalosine hydrolase [Desulfobacteraceae bacterium]